MKRFTLLVFCALLAFTTYAQTEICNDGIDNDGDGLTDCYDPDCINFVGCNGSFTNKDVLCQAKPVAFPQFTIKQDFASANGTTNHLSRVAIGDLDRDGIPEIVTMNRYSKQLFVLDGRTAAIKYSITTSFEPQWEIAIANIDNDNCGEIFTFGYESSKYYLYSYSCDLTTQNWKHEINTSNATGTDDPVNFGLADFDGDGKVELYVKDEIFDAHTGTRLIQSKTWYDAAGNLLANGGPVAVDIMGDKRLELVVGGVIYDVNLTANGARGQDSGVLTELTRISKANGYPMDYILKNQFNATSVADYNLDGSLDVIASGGLKDAGGHNVTTVYFWDVKNKTVKTFSDPIAGSFTINNCSSTNTSNYYQYGWINGTGRVNIADLDGNGKMNASYVSGKFLYALDENFNLLWRITVNEETSGYTGCTLFDFNGDGKAEIVYRDEKYIYILNGTDGSIFTQQPCVSRTNREYPIVSDVDADGATEICVPCGTVDADALANFCNLNYSTNSQLRIFKSASEPWVPARRLWNQHGYFVVNVNDDLTIPKIQQSQLTVFSTGSCTPGPNRPLNSFLNQSPFLDSKGCPTYASPDLAYVQNSLSVSPPTCPDKNFTVSFSITNKGDVQLDGVVPITFYSGDPTKTGAIKLNTVNVTLVAFAKGAVFAVTNATVNGIGSPFTLYIVLNDNGTTVPTPIVLPNTNFVECDYGNNIISAPVNPKPVSLTALKVADNLKCVGSATPDNGAVRAFVPVGATENTADYTFYWSKGTTAKPIATADYVGAAYTGLAQGSYTVYAINKTASCSSDTVTVTVGQTNRTMAVTINLLQGVTNCTHPNGQLQAIVNNGELASNFTYAWYLGNVVLTGTEVGVNDIATDLSPGTFYSVYVTDKLSGCHGINSFQVPDNTVKPVVSATPTDIICSNATSGAVTANVGGATTGYTFNWYDGNTVKPVADFTGSSANNLAANNYTVTASNTTTECTSNPLTITVKQTTPPVVTATLIAAQNSCDNSRPNGAASASATGGTGSYTYEWFNGQNTLPANSISTATSISGKGVGIYTVKVKDAVTGCSSTDDVTITYVAAAQVTITASPSSQTQCVPYNGSITASVSSGSVSDYTFSWYKGSTVKTPLPAPDFPDTDNVLNTLQSGNYYVSAVNNLTHCLATTQTAIVIDASPTISITLNSSITLYPTKCAVSDGAMAVDVSAPGNTLGFNVDWYKGAAPLTPPPFFNETVATTSTASSLFAGVYSALATDLNSGCQGSKHFDLPFAGSPSLTLNAKGDVTKCIPSNGSVAVDLTPAASVPSFTATEADYDLFVYAGQNDLGAAGSTVVPPVTGTAGITTYTTSGLIPQYYSVVAVPNNPSDPNFACRSLPVTVELLNNTTNPTISASANNPNTSCSVVPGSGSGSLTASAASGVNCTFDWYNGPDTSGAIQVTSPTYSSLFAGYYTVVATVTDPTSTGCTTTETYSIADNPALVSIAGSGLTTQNLLNCDASNNASPTGTATVMTITPGTPANYTYVWKDNGGTTLQSSASPALTGLAAGTYFVTATNTTSSCSTDLQFDITDQTKGTVSVDLTSFQYPIRCISPQDGELLVKASGTSAAATPYTYEWFSGSTASGVVVNGSNDFTGITVPTGQPSVTYSIKVINNSNNCYATDTYVLPLTVKEVLASVSSSSPLTFCSSNNGIVFGVVINDQQSPPNNTYTYTWTNVSTTPQIVYPANATGTVNNLGAGTYSMIAVSDADNFCASQPKTVTLLDQRVTPVVTAAQSSPLTNCDPTKLNGLADASVNGDNINYTFNWYKGTTVTGTPFYTGSEAGGLADSVYTVSATDNITGCTGSAQVVILRNLTVVPTPQITVLSNVTSCILTNGSLSASVGGDTQDYIFNWYIGQTPKATTDYTGEVVNDVDVGFYTVTATDRLTGCTSGPDTDQIIKDQTFPSFDFTLTGASCEKNDGSAALILENEVTVESIIWDNNGTPVYGPILANIPSGAYNVTVTTQLGCAVSKTIQIKTDITPFNGVSQNGDGKNDKFVINCIDNFPDNNVKIFNRAGTMVYESNGYNNSDTFFDGKSNKGVSPMGIVLPDGTYFYIIDKKDGSKTLAGYLELVH